MVWVTGPGHLWCVQVWDLLTHTVPTILIISQGVPVQTSLIYTMEGSATTLYQLMATDELLLWPLTPATLASH